MPQKAKVLDHADVATQYARDVVSGKIPNNKFIILAAKRHLDDLERSKSRDFPYTFDHVKANRPVTFIELLPHVEGKWASRGEYIRLEPWQKFLVCSVFGWVKKTDGYRRFKTVYVCVPRKSGKSSLTAGIGLYGLILDGEYGAKVYSGANSREQASFIFDPAKKMAARVPQLAKHYGVEVNADSIVVSKTNSKFTRLIGNPGDGANPHFALIDEMHEADDSRLYDAMTSGMGAREQPLVFVITTAGFNTAGPCYFLQKDMEKMLEGVIEDETQFALIYTIDTQPYTDPYGVHHEADDWTTEAALRKANPNWGISVNIEDALKQQEQAVRATEKQNVFKTKKLNIWCFARNGYFNVEKWDQCADLTLKIENFQGQPCVKGLDLASKLDLSANLTVFQKMHEDGVLHYYIFSKFYVPEATVALPTNAHYQKWVYDGWLESTPGDEIALGQIRSDIIADTALYDVKELCFDQHQATLMKQDIIEETAVLTAEIPQNAPTLNMPMKELQAMIQAGRIHHDGNPVMTWCISNVVSREDAKRNDFPRKERPESKIDGVTALLCALYRVREALGEGKSEFYEYNGF